MEAMKTRKDEQPRTDTNKDVKTSKKPKRRSPQRPAGDSTRGRMTAAVTHLAFYPPIKIIPRETPRRRKPKREKTNRSDGCLPSTGHEGRITNTKANSKGAVDELDTILPTPNSQRQTNPAGKQADDLDVPRLNCF